jgi:hypothetical protein
VIGLVLTAPLFSFVAGAAEQPVAMRSSSGRFLRLGENGPVAKRLLPGDSEAFELVSDADGRVALKAADGRFLSTGGASAGQFFRLVEVDGNLAALEAVDGSFLVLDPKADAGDPSLPIDQPRPVHTVEVFRLGHVPAAIQAELARLLRAEVVDEVGDEPYEKTRTRKKRRYIELPAPTARDPKRTKRHRVLSMDEEYQVRVQLNGPPEIRVLAMPYLEGYYQPAAGSLMLSIQAILPLEGRVRYKIPDVLSASTGFRAIVEVTAAAEVRSRKSGQSTSLNVPELIDLAITVRSLDVSNDALSLVREPLEDLINEELRDKRERVREKANRSIRKAIDKGEFRIPLLQWLVLPRLK